MKNKFLAALFLTPIFAQAQTTTSTESLSSLMGAINQVIAQKTEIQGVDEVPAKMTPPGEKVFKALADDLDLCQSSKTNEPELVVVEKEGVSVKFKKFDLRIYGEKCPFEVLASLRSTEQTNDNLSAQFILKVVFKTEAYIQKYKMKFIEATGDINVKAQKIEDTVHLPVHMTIASHGESTELGPLSQEMSADITIDANLKQFSFGVLTEQKATMIYNGKTQKAFSRAKIAGFNQPEVIFTIDDKEVSESEYQAFLQSFALPTVFNEKDPNAPDGKAPTQCHFVAYDKKNISAENLKLQLQNSTLQTEGQLANGQSCLSNLTVPYTQNDQAYSGQVTFGEEWISFASASKAKPELNASVYVLYGEKAVLTRETETQILGIQCLEVPACH
jgi:hypothetical protein